MVDQSKLAAQTDAVFKSSRGYAKGGMPEDVDIQRVDPVSGNEVPPGSLPAEVRDDIPAQLSEGEYVVPADVVRYYGVKFFEDLRSDAKMGWDAMDQNGRIGGEPMGPSGMEMGNDELPFDLSELQFDEVDVPEENVLKAAEGMYVSGYSLGDFVKSLFGGSPQERAERKKAKGAYGYADGGYAKSEGDPGYETEGALGLGSKGLGLQGGLEMRKYENAAGEIRYIPFVDGIAQVVIPEGFYPFGEVPPEETDTSTTTAPTVEDIAAEDDDGYTKPMQSVNFQELSNAELADMLKQQQGLTGNAIAAAAGVVNPIMGLAVKFAMYDTSKRIKKELERRAADPNLTDKEKLEVKSMLEVANKDQPKLIERLFTAVKEKVEDIVDPQERVETNQGAPTRGALGLTREERLMEQAIPTFVPEESLGAPVEAKTVEELPTKETKPEDDIITLDEIVVDAEKDSQDYVIDENGIMIPVASSSEKFNKAGQGDSMTPLTDAFGTGNVFTSGPQTPSATTGLGSSPNAMARAAASMYGKTQDTETGGGTFTSAYKPTTATPDVYTPTASETQREKVKRENTKAIIKAINEGKPESQINAMKSAAAKSEDYFANKEASDAVAQKKAETSASTGGGGSSYSGGYGSGDLPKTTSTVKKESIEQKIARGGGFSKGGLASKKKKK